MRAIVLSGGGARGAYQIGAWRALKKLNIDFDIVTGTSVGAFNGALMVQNDFRKAYKIWKNMNYDFVFSDDVNLDDKKGFVKTYLRSLVKYGGMNVDALENNVDKYLNYKKFIRSNIDFGIVTYNLSSKTEKKLVKKELDEKKFADYLMASATCYPAFRKKIIDGNTYIDGGYVNDLPLDVAISLGATEIIAINIGFGGTKKTVDFKDHEIKILKPRNKLDSFLGFDKKYSRRLLKLGYNDTLKEYGKLDGMKYTFKKGMIRMMFKKYNEKFIEKCTIILGDSLAYRNVSEFFDKYEISFLEMLEYGADIFKVKDEKIYSRITYNHYLRKGLKHTKITDIKQIVLDNKRVIKSHVVKHLYELMKEKKYEEVKRLSLIFKKEFLLALYLYII